MARTEVELIRDRKIVSADFSAGAVDEAALGTDAVTTTKIKDKSVTASKLADAINFFPSGGIVLWSGVTTNIPSGWVLCDGQNSTPDLRGKFIIGAGGSYNYDGKWTWLQKPIYGGSSTTRTNLDNLFSTANEVFLGDAKQFSGYGNAWSSQKDVRFYGYNYTGGHGAATRWGFGWNENGGGLYPNGNMSSDDVSGGIGMNPSFGRDYSAGDYIRCCQDSTGINRSARVEIYVR